MSAAGSELVAACRGRSDVVLAVLSEAGWADCRPAPRAAPALDGHDYGDGDDDGDDRFGEGIGGDHSQRELQGDIATQHGDAQHADGVGERPCHGCGAEGQPVVRAAQRHVDVVGDDAMKMRGRTATSGSLMIGVVL